MKKMHYLASIALCFLLFSCAEQKKAETEENSSQPAATDYTKALEGAWTTTETNRDGEKIQVTTIVMEGFLAESFYNVEKKLFERSFGGSWTVEGNTFTILTEFATSDTAQIGKTRSIVFDLKGDTIRFQGDDRLWTRIDNGQKGNLSGAYLITGRKRDGEMKRWTPDARKTMKILSDTRFQWIAYNVETKEFFGTGGGTYTAEDQSYTENIEFFSRDSSRVGASLGFDFKIVDGEWHHSGLSSKGDPIHEIWTHRRDLE